jgi:DNA repair protein RecN (Recombination protein N)
MLRTLDIRDMLIIDHLSLAFDHGLNILTGETGAGKSILLDSLGFVLGWRGRAELVRQGAEQGEVTAVFDLARDHPARAVLAEAGIEVGSELILRRVNFTDGRKLAWVNERRASGEVLRALSDHLVELHGQQDDRGLLNPRGHRLLLDDFAKLNLAPCRAAWAEMGRAAKALAQAQEALDKMTVQEDYLRHAVTELDKLDPKAGEDTALDIHRRQMKSAQKSRADIARVLATLSDKGAEGMMGTSFRLLDDLAAHADPIKGLEAPIASLGRAMTELGEAIDSVERLLAALDFHPQDLENLEERLFSIRALARKHNVVPDDLVLFSDTLRTQLAALDGSTKGILGLTQTLTAAKSRYATEAEALSAVRQASAKRLDQAMAGELAPLKMERAFFETTISPQDPGPEGQDLVAFCVATNPGMPSGPLNRIASGGELARFLLALKVCLRGDSPSLTIIFDEIDRGVGGATADAVGRRLVALARGGQVLVVTHSPQVAALGAHHWRVEKQVKGGLTRSTVTALKPADRIEEIARMLAGDTITQAARDAANALLGTPP